MATEGQLRIDNSGNSVDVLSVHRHHSKASTPAPISRLPPELLAGLFLRCALDDHGQRSLFTRAVPSWVNVSYVCRYWREVALGCPNLWAFHFVVSRRWTEELLMRSKQAPLKICLKFEHRVLNSWWLGPVNKLMSDAERFQELTLYLPNSSTHHVLSMLSSPAPSLERLQISAPNFRPERSFVPFHGDTPALRTLILSNCAVPWYLFKLSALTTLHVFCLPTQFQQDTVEFLATLSSMQGLAELSLDSALSSAAGFLRTTEFSTLQKINLPHLATLFLRAPLSAIITLLSCIDPPSGVRGRLDCFPENDPSDNFTLLSSVLAQRFGLAEDQPPSSRIRSLIIQFTANRSASFLFSLRERDCDALNSPFRQANFWDSNVPLVLTVNWSEPMVTVEDRVASDVCRAILLTDVQTLHVIRPLLSPVFWRKTLGRLQGLRFIKLSQGNMPDLASVLSVTNRIPEDVENRANDQDQDDVMVRDLEELELSWIKISPEGGLYLPAVTRKSLFDALASRGVPGGRLVMNFCTIGGYGRLNAIRSWDGLVNVPIVAKRSSLSYHTSGLGGSLPYHTSDLGSSLSYHTSGLGSDDSGDDSETDLDGDSEEDSDVDWDDYLEGESEDESGGSMESALEEHSEDDSGGASHGTPVSESEGNSEGHLEVTSESTAESSSEGDSDVHSEGGSELEVGSEADSGDNGDSNGDGHSDGDLGGDSEGGFEGGSGDDWGDEYGDDYNDD